MDRTDTAFIAACLDTICEDLATYACAGPEAVRQDLLTLLGLTRATRQIIAAADMDPAPAREGDNVVYLADVLGVDGLAGTS